jgi:hypothetical protein
LSLILALLNEPVEEDRAELRAQKLQDELAVVYDTSGSDDEYSKQKNSKGKSKVLEFKKQNFPGESRMGIMPLQRLKFPRVPRKE